MRLGYYDKYGRVQVAEVICSDKFDDVSCFWLASGFTSVPLSFKPWDDDLEIAIGNNSVERCVRFSGISNDKHDEIVFGLIENGWWMIEKEFVGELGVV